MIYLFDHNETLIGQLHSSHIMNATQEEVLNGIVRLDFEIAIPFIDKMEDVEFVAHKDINEPDQFHYYKITNTVNSDNTMQYTAIATFFDDMRAYGYIREKRMTATNARLAMETLLHGSRWRVGYSDVGKQADFYLYDNTRLEALSQLIDTFNVEIKFRIKINGNQISDRLVDVYNRIGYDTHKRFHYGSNALTVVREEIQDEVYTAIIGRGKGEEKFDTDGEATGGFGRRIDFKDVEWLKSKGNPLDKPKGQEYIEIPEMTLLYGYSDGTPRFGIKVHDKIEDPEELLEACYQDLIKSSRPLVQFKSSIQELGRVFLGDTIGIIRKELNIFYKTRVFRIKRNLLNDDIAEIEFGDNLELNQAFKNKELVNNIKDLNSRVSDIAENANLAFVSVWQKLKDEFNDGFLNEDGYNYELRAGNIYGMPAGYYSFNAPIDQNPTKVIYMGAGKLMIANRKDSNGIWDFTTALDGDGVKAESIVGLLGEFAAINANQINVNNDFAETQLGKKVVIQDRLYNNVKITQDKGVQVLDANNRERVQLGNWATNRYGLKLTDQTGRNTILDDNGILQTWQDGRCDNIDNNYPLRLRIFVPRETARIYKSLLRIYVEKYRAFSKGTTAAGYDSDSTEGGGYQEVFESTESGGGDYVSRTTDVDRYVYGVRGGHNHGITHETFLWGKRPGMSEYGYAGGFVQSGNHDHNFSFTLNSHKHLLDFKIYNHTHKYTVESHKHETIYGIHEDYSSGSNMQIFINGTNRTAALTGSNYFSYNQSELNITNYLSIGTWNTIEIRCANRARVDATVFVQALLNYGGY